MTASRAMRGTIQVLTLLAGVMLLGAVAEGCGQRQPAGFVGSGTCLACHDGRTASNQTEFRAGLHEAIDCETCHGPGALHVRNVGRGSGFITNPGKLPLPASVALCSECHASQHGGFLESLHAASGVSCHDCHNVHKQGGMRFSTANRTALSHAGYAQACGSCHAPEVADYARSRHFELPEVTCRACHSMHVGSMFTANPASNSLCLQCHQSRTLGFVSAEVIDQHTGPFHPVDPLGTGSSRCVSCHLPPSDAIRGPDGPHSHTLAAIPPARTNDAIAGGAAVIPANSCAGVTGCHDEGVPGSGMPHDVFDIQQNALLQTIYDTIGATP